MELIMIHPNDDEKTFLNAYGKYFKDLKKIAFEACPSASCLNDYYNKKLSGKEMQALEEHINLCPACTAALERLQAGEQDMSKEIALPENWPDLEKIMDLKFQNYRDSAAPLERVFEKHPERKNYFELLKQKLQQFWDMISAPSGLAYAGSLAILVIVALYSFAYLNRPIYFNLARIEPERQGISRTENGALTTLSEGLKFFSERNYEQAITKFETYLEANPDNYTVNFYLGLAYLFSAEVTLPGLSYKFDALKVGEGIKYLGDACSRSSENQFYLEECYWYLGKAYLMRGEAASAKAQFSKIIQLGQSNLMRKHEAQDMILEIEKLTK
jgi:tetratricopeptide (TPR) repeat protein